tara:strand:+ start:2310 stop:3569 length:1260 start_codon:yes stop_codon:yes gene_type:complete
MKLNIKSFLINFLSGLFIILSFINFNGCSSNNDISLSIEESFNNTNIPAVSMGYYIRGEKEEFFNFGNALWEENKKVTPDHIFRIASMTKVITSVGAMQLVERGMITLDEPVKKILPIMDKIKILDDLGNLVEPKNEITLRHLLTHTAGFAYAFTSNKLNDITNGEWAADSSIWNYNEYPGLDFHESIRIFDSGKEFRYGANTDWVGLIIEQVSELSLEDYLRKNITGPLEMDKTWFNVPEELSHLIVDYGNRQDNGEIISNNDRVSPKTTRYYGGGGLKSSPSDYMIFLKCLLNYGELDGVKILKRETVETMIANHLDGNLIYENIKFPSINFNAGKNGTFFDEKDKWSLAWAIENNPKEKFRPIGTGYWGGYFNSYFTINYDEQMIIVYFTQFTPFNDKESYSLFKEFEKILINKYL